MKSPQLELGVMGDEHISRAGARVGLWRCGWELVRPI